jgi:dTDP-4-dehydrorhamnose reductase
MGSTTKIIVTGANGQLGKELSRISTGNPLFEIIFLSREDLSIRDVEKIVALFEKIRPAFCINCAAYTAVDKAESEKELAFLVNGQAVGALAAACHKTGARLIHISTDYVFDGHSAEPLREDHPTSPVNVYGASKLLGEQLARERHPAGTVIIRTSWVYSEFGNNFVKTMIRLMREKTAISVINDQIGSPTYAADLAGAILQIAGGGRFVPGTYHYSNEGQISWYEFALAIKELTSSACTVHSIPTSEYPTPAKRPHYSLLDKNLIRNTYDIKTPAWRESLVLCISRLDHPFP